MSDVEVDPDVKTMTVQVYYKRETLKPVVNAEKEGWLIKQGGSYKSWKKRFFVLCGNMLFYFKTSEGPVAQGIIYLEDSEVKEYRIDFNDRIDLREAKEAEDFNPDFAMSIVNKERVYKICTRGAEERFEWMDAISKAKYRLFKESQEVVERELHKVASARAMVEAEKKKIGAELEEQQRNVADARERRLALELNNDTVQLEKERENVRKLRETLEEDLASLERLKAGTDSEEDKARARERDRELAKAAEAEVAQLKKDTDHERSCIVTAKKEAEDLKMKIGLVSDKRAGLESEAARLRSEE